jgi:hypothetical protein
MPVMRPLGEPDLGDEFALDPTWPALPRRIGDVGIPA